MSRGADLSGRSARRRIGSAVLGGLAAAILLSGCSTTAITDTRLQQSIGPTFSRLFQLQQNEIGRTGTTAPDRSASCVRAGSTARSGAGSWLCTVNFPDPDGHIEPLALDVEVQAIGCYTATGPPSVLGQQQIRTATGHTVTNPLFAFDGCFDTT